MTKSKQQKESGSYTDESKQQLMQGDYKEKRRYGKWGEYNIAASLLDKWMEYTDVSHLYYERDNHWTGQQELMERQKHFTQLETEKYILKQGALIFEQEER